MEIYLEATINLLLLNGEKSRVEDLLKNSEVKQIEKNGKTIKYIKNG